MCRLIIVFLFISLSCGTVLADFDRVHDPRDLDAAQLLKYRAHYEVGAEGQIIMGAVREPQDPVDYSPLLDEAVLQTFFLETLLGCNDQSHWCSAQIHPWPETGFSIALVQEGAALNRENIETVVEPIIDVFLQTDLPIEFTETPEQSNLLIYIGGPGYLWQKARGKRDRKALRHLEDNQSLGCFTSNRDRESDGRVVIYVTHPALETCFRRALAEAMNLYPSQTTLPSVTRSDGTFSGLTYLDEFALRLLRAAGGPLMRDRGALDALWEAESAGVRLSLDEKTLRLLGVPPE